MEAANEKFLFQEQPQALDGIDFRRSWRQRRQRDVGGHLQMFRAAPPSLVERPHDMFAGRDRLGELVEIDLHRFGRHFGHVQSECVACSRFNGTEIVGSHAILIIGRQL